MKKHPRLPGFTLIELLVTIGIIALLIGLLAPALASARRTAQRTRCAAHLKNLGAAWLIYADEHDNVMPHAVSMPQPISAGVDELTILKVLKPYVRDAGVYRCPADDRDFFAQLGTSYEYVPGLVIALNPGIAGELSQLAAQRPELLPILSDGAEFHAAPATSTPRQTVYHDAHVDWLFDELPDVALD